MLTFEELTELFRKHIKEMLERKNVVVLDRVPDDLKLINYNKYFTLQNIADMGIEKIMKILTSELLHIIFDNYSEEMESGHYPHYSIYFKEEPTIRGEHLDSLYVYKVEYSFGSFVSHRAALSDHKVNASVVC